MSTARGRRSRPARFRPPARPSGPGESRPAVRPRPGAGCHFGADDGRPATPPGLLSVGAKVTPGQIIAHLGDRQENGGWAPHLHFQVIGDHWDQNGGNFFGVGHESLWDVWRDICPDPNLILRLPAGKFLA